MSNATTVHEIKRAQKERFLFRELSQMLHQLSLEDARLKSLLINRVSLSPDKSMCMVYFYNPEGKEAFEEQLEVLKLYRPSIRKAMAGKMQSRYVPDFRFKFDNKFEKQERLEQLLEKVKTEDS